MKLVQLMLTLLSVIAIDCNVLKGEECIYIYFFCVRPDITF